MTKYPKNIFVDYIDRDSVDFFNKNCNIRYTLELDNMESESERSAAIILLHPFGAEQFNSDIMTNQIIRFLCKQDYQNIRFVSLFPYNVSTASELRELVITDELTNVIEENSNVIQMKMLQSDTIILAWGDRPHYIPKMKFQAAIRFIANLLKNEHIHKKTMLFKYANRNSITLKGCPESPHKKVIEGIDFYEKKLRIYFEK